MNDQIISVQWDDTANAVAFRREISSVVRIDIHDRILNALATGPAGYKTLLEVLNSDGNYDLLNEADLRNASRNLLTDDAITVDVNGVLRIATPETKVKEAESLPIAPEGEGVTD